MKYALCIQPLLRISGQQLRDQIQMLISSLVKDSGTHADIGRRCKLHTERLSQK